MIESGKGSVVKWGNQIGFIILPVHIAMHSDPLDYIRKAKNIVDMKKNSLEAVSTYMVAEVFHKIFGWKVHVNLIFFPFGIVAYYICLQDSTHPSSISQNEHYKRRGS